MKNRLVENWMALSAMVKKIYLPRKTTQKHSVKCLSDVCIHLMELKLSVSSAGLKQCFSRICKWILEIISSEAGYEIPSHKN